jgi:hypothetical protein
MKRHYLFRLALPGMLLMAAWPLTARASNLATGGYYEQDPVQWPPVNPSAPNLPMYCAVVVEADGGAPGQTLNASGYLACGNVFDSATYSWTWTDEGTGTVLLTQSGTVYNTADAATKTGAAVGTPGQRKLKLCWATTKAGYYPASDCRVLDRV